MKEIEMYIDWVNNYISIKTFAEHYQISEEEARKAIEKGRQAHYQGSGVLGNEI